ncbi:MAG: hypothetical protein JW702_03700 [Clostridiales bacterium]|nr:hypothetical protein [Clostridiales bacterium]
MNEYMIALFGTFVVFMTIRMYKSINRFNLLTKIKQRVLILTTVYLVEHPDADFVKYQYRNFIYRKLEEEKIKQWVDAIDIKWITETKLIVSFDMVYNNNVRMKFEYPLDMKELKIKKVIKRSE